MRELNHRFAGDNRKIKIAWARHSATSNAQVAAANRVTKSPPFAFQPMLFGREASMRPGLSNPRLTKCRLMAAFDLLQRRSSSAEYTGGGTNLLLLLNRLGVR
jgi:hypothetical protein